VTAPVKRCLISIIALLAERPLPIAQLDRSPHSGPMRTSGYIAIAVLAGCTHTVVDLSNCANRVGTYRLTFTARSGDCGAISEQIASLNDTKPIMVVPMCAAQESISNDHCAVTAEIMCATMSGGMEHDVGVVRWSHDASSATGTVQITVTDKAGAQVCDGTYDLVEVRL